MTIPIEPHSIKNMTLCHLLGLLLVSLVLTQHVTYITTRPQPMKVSQIISSGKLLMLKNSLQSLMRGKFKMQNLEKTLAELDKNLPACVPELTSLLTHARDLLSGSDYTSLVLKF